MRSLLEVTQQKHLLLTALAWGWFEVAFFPKPMLLFFLGGAMSIDLITGIVKSWRKGVKTNAELLQKSVSKLTRYCSVIIAVWFMVNIINTIGESKFNYAFFVNGCIGFLSFIELYSVFGNVYAIDPTGPLSVYFVGPILKFLKAKLENNPINQFENQKNNGTANDDNAK